MPDYEEIKAPLGSTIDEVVELLLDYRSRGKLASFRFNGVMLYSDTVSLDSAYLKIAGMTKTELYNL